MTGGMRIDSYDWRGGREAMLRFGPDDGARVILALPLHEEANRLRAFAAAVLRDLAALGIGGVLPDFPGTGDSLIETRQASLCAIRTAYADLARPADFAVSIRSGALLDTDATMAGRWHLSPIEGDALHREMARATGDDGLMAGNAVGDAMMRDLAGARTLPARVVRLDSDPRPADRTIDAPPLWRRAEPGNDPALAATVASDIADWIATCDG